MWKAIYKFTIKDIKVILKGVMLTESLNNINTESKNPESLQLAQELGQIRLEISKAKAVNNGYVPYTEEEKADLKSFYADEKDFQSDMQRGKNLVTELKRKEYDLIEQYYKTQVKNLFPIIDSNNPKQSFSFLKELTTEMPKLIKKLDMLVKQFGKIRHPSWKNTPVLDLLGVAYRSIEITLDRLTFVTKVLHPSTEKGETITGYGLGERNVEFELNLDLLCRTVDNYFLNHKELVLHQEKLDNRKYPNTWDHTLLSLYERQFSRGNLQNIDNYFKIIEKFPDTAEQHIPFVILLADTTQYHPVKEKLIKLTSFNNYQSRDIINNIIFVHAILQKKGVECSDRLNQIFSEIMGESQEIVQQYLFRWRVSHRLCENKNDGATGENLLQFVEIKQQHPNLAKQLREELNIYCLARYSKDYLTSLPQRLKEKKPYTLTVTAIDDHNNVLSGVGKTVDFMQSQLGDKANCIAIEAGSFFSIASFIRGRQKKGYEIPQILHVAGHGNSRSMLLQGGFKGGSLDFSTRYNEKEKLPMVVQWLKNHNITTVLDSCLTGDETDPNGLFSQADYHGMEVIAPKSTVSGRMGTKIELVVQDQTIKIQNVEFPMSEASYTKKFLNKQQS